MITAAAASAPKVEASCAICGAPASPECPHETERLSLALEQAMVRWVGRNAIRDWVVIHARNAIISAFQTMKSVRQEQHLLYIQTLPYYALYQRYQGNPPLQGGQLQLLHSQMAHADAIYKAGIDEDWRASCLRYPEVLDYYFSLVEWTFPGEREQCMGEPRFGAPVKEARRVKARDGGSGAVKGHRKTHRRGHTPPPVAPMPGAYW